MLTRLAIALALAMSAGVPLAAAADELSVVVSPTEQSADVRSQFEVSATITNEGDTVTRPVTAHLEIIDPTRAGSVDAEDWVPDLNTTIDPLAPGSSREVNWTLKPIAGGNFAVYVAALPESAGSEPAEAVVASKAIAVDVREVRTLNAGGALPVAIIVPLLLAGGLVAIRLRPGWRRGGPTDAGAGTY